MAQENNNSASQKYDYTFMYKLSKQPNGHLVSLCMQCGLCAVTCPTRELMDYTPRQLFNLIKQGEQDKVLSSNTMWMCTSCYTCKVRCPRGIAIVDVMHDLKYLAITEGREKYPQMAFYDAFWKEVLKRGKSFETGVLVRFYLQKGKDGIKEMLAMKDLGLSMLKHKRITITPPPKVVDQSNLQLIIEKAQEMQSKGEV